MKKYLVLTGNEYGIDILNNTDLNFCDKDDAEDKYNHYIEEYGVACMIEVYDDKLKVIKSESIMW